MNTLDNFAPREGAGQVEALLRRAAIRSVGGRCIGELATTSQGMPADPSHTSAVRWSVLGALMAERGLSRVPQQERLVFELRDSVACLMDVFADLRSSIDYKRNTVIDVLRALNNWVEDEALHWWWTRAIEIAKERGL